MSLSGITCKMGGHTAATWGARTCEAAEAAPRGCLCAQHTGCAEGAASLRSGLCYVLRRRGTHIPPPPGTRGHDRAGIAEAGEGGRHSDQQAPFVPPSIAIDRRQTGLHFRVSISAVPGGGRLQFAGEEEWGPRTFCQSEAQGAARQIGERCQIGQRKAHALVPASPRERGRRHQEVVSQDQTSAQPSAATWGLLLEGNPPPPPNRGGWGGGVLRLLPTPRIPAAWVPKLPLLF